MAIDPTQLADLEAGLTDNIFTDDEIVERVRAAGLPELARVLRTAFSR
ncbi:hypothetical protein OG225_43045 (plasmid) [Nocardia sp. NBC_01377]